jgi:hypothetical protein
MSDHLENREALLSSKRVRLFLCGLLFAVLAMACVHSSVPAEENGDEWHLYGVQRLHVPNSYHTMWESVQECSGREVPIISIRFFVADSMLNPYRGQRAVGLFYPHTRSIYLQRGLEEDPVLVRHEMLHALGFEHNDPEMIFCAR